MTGQTACLHAQSLLPFRKDIFIDQLIYIFGSLVLNFPFGMYRARTRKFSFQWILAIHAPIPAIIAARFALDVSAWLIPAGIAAAVVGQVVGARLLASEDWKAVGQAKQDAHAAAKSVGQQEA